MKMWLYICLCFTFVLCDSDESDLDFSLEIGNSMDVFANYGDLSQVIQVVSGDYIEDTEMPVEIFQEKNIRVFANASSQAFEGDSSTSLDIHMCETVDDLLATYFQTFYIEGTAKPWKAFMGDWVMSEILRTFGIEYDEDPEDCCYVLVKLTKTHTAVKLGDLTDVTLQSYVQRAIERLNVSDPVDVRQFMKSYGTHYIESYSTGNLIYQIFRYKRPGYNRLRTYLRLKNKQPNSRTLRYYFSSYYLKDIGDIRIASGNKTVERWARKNLRDIQYLYSRQSLLKLFYTPNLAYKLKNLLDNGALLSLSLKTLKPLFKDRHKGELFQEIVENDMQLWENNA